MKINNIAVGTIFALGLSLLASPAYAEEIVEETPVVEEAPAAAPEPEPEYVPPPEASEGVGGWAVVDPETGRVHGVVVADTGYYERNGGVIGTEYMGCHSQCVLRFQSRAQDSGNVVGIYDDGLNEVSWDGDSKSTFSVNSGGDESNSSSTLIPSKTMQDGSSLSTGFVNTRTKTTTGVGVEINQLKEDYEDIEIETDILFPEWGIEGKLFSYSSGVGASSNIEKDVDRQLFLEGYTSEVAEIDEVAAEATIDEENAFVKTVRIWTESVINFFRGILS